VKKFVKKFVYKFFKLNPIISQQESINAGFMKNIFKTHYSQNALLSFLTFNFEKENINYQHTNKHECIAIAEILSEFGYNVDLVNYDLVDFIPNEEYSLIVGFGLPIENILYKNQKKSFKLILYRNGCSQEVSDPIAISRIHKIYKETGFLLAGSTRIFPFSLKLQHAFADLLLVLGNNFVKTSFFDSTQCKIELINLFYFDVGQIDVNIKSFKHNGNYLWFGSIGAIHKGLDLLLKYFELYPTKILYICGFNASEEKFMHLFKQELELPNIINKGFIDLHSEEMKEILIKCSAVVLPSVSEGGGGAILNVIAAGGLIPIITKNVGLDFDQNEIIINDFTLESIIEAFSEFEKLDDDQLKSRSINLMNFIREKHTLENYKKSIKKAITQVLWN